jgi:hypothetical protein
VGAMWHSAMLGFAAAMLIALVASQVGVSGAVFLLPVQLSVLHVPCPACCRPPRRTTRRCRADRCRCRSGCRSHLIEVAAP